MAAKKKTTAMARRTDFGTPIDGYIEKHEGEQRAILEALRGLVVEAMPKAESMMMVAKLAELPKKEIEGWLKVAAKR